MATAGVGDGGSANATRFAVFVDNDARKMFVLVKPDGDGAFHKYTEVLGNYGTSTLTKAQQIADALNASQPTLVRGDTKREELW